MDKNVTEGIGCLLMCLGITAIIVAISLIPYFQSLAK